MAFLQKIINDLSDVAFSVGGSLGEVEKELTCSLNGQQASNAFLMVLSKPLVIWI
jgi:hypothetical protein